MLYIYELLFLVQGIALVWGSLSVYDRVKKYFRKEKRLNEIEEQYERLRSSRRDFLQHMYWAKSEGEKKKAKQLKEEIFKLDDELVSLKEQFDLISSGKNVPLKSVPQKQH